MDDSKREWEGSFVPKEAFDLLEQGLITPTELVLLTIINSLVNKNKQHGCYAKNATLARLMNLSPRHTQLCISRLLELGLIKKYWAPHNGETSRYFVTAYKTLERYKSDLKIRNG